MDYIGGFHFTEINGDRFLVYHQLRLKQQPIPQRESSTSSVEPESNNEPLYLCPKARETLEEEKTLDMYFFPFKSTPEYVGPTTITKKGWYDKSMKDSMKSSHPVLLLSNYDIEDSQLIDDIDESECGACEGSNLGTNCYFCELCEEFYHKECVEAPHILKHPYHTPHSLKLYNSSFIGRNVNCVCCETEAKNLVYQCTICNVSMHPTCAMKLIPFDIHHPKRHDHPLTLFPRQTSLTCNVCGLLRKLFPTYICVQCNFVAHKDCMFFPRVIRISRHQHRISHSTSLPSGDWSCGVCRQKIDCDYGAYTCDKCDNYAVHSKCALRNDVCDGMELEDVPEEDDIAEDAPPFKIISDGKILHFLHHHHLQLEVSILYDENKLCQGCALPIYKDSFYSCKECNFIHHGTCASSPRRLYHALHPHPLTLKTNSGYEHGTFGCNACNRISGCFVYQCPITTCQFDLDVTCASISEPLATQLINNLCT